MQRDVIIYDGECAFCIRQIDRIQQKDRDAVFDYVPRQQEGLDARFPELARADFNTGMRLVAVDGEIFVGADAVYQIARRIPGWRRWTFLYRMPVFHQLARWIYAWVASHRRSLGQTCESGQCRIDTKNP